MVSTLGTGAVSVGSTLGIEAGDGISGGRCSLVMAKSSGQGERGGQRNSGGVGGGDGRAGSGGIEKFGGSIGSEV